MKGYDRNCPMCRFMRSLAFTGVGMGVGCGVAYLVDASYQNMLISGIVVSAIIVFGMQKQTRK